MQNVLSSFTALNQLPLDWVIFIAFGFVVTADTLRSGTDRGATFILSIPVVLFLYSQISHSFFVATIFKQIPVPYNAGIFLILCVAVLFIMYRSVASLSGTSTGAVINATLIGIASTIVAIVAWLSVPELQSFIHFGRTISALFSETYRFWWIILSLIILGFVRT